MDTDLIYMNARYENPSSGQFLSPDDVTQALGDDVLTKAYTGNNTQSYLHNPQGLNTYAYTRNNPVMYTDPDGRVLDTALDIGFITYDIGSLGKNLYQGNYTEAKTDAQALGLDTLGAAIPFGTGFGLAVRGREAVNIVNKVRSLDGLVSDASKYWKGTNMSVSDSMRYHLKKHGKGLSVEEYTDKAVNFYLKALDNSKDYVIKTVELKDPSKSVGVKITNKLTGEAGIYDKAGNIITYILGKK